MTTKPTADIPCYQAIDIILGSHTKATSEPTPGFFVAYADIGCLGLFETEEAMTDATARAASKYEPQIFKAWIHTEGNRQHWSPR